jgi:hypothetical protein
VLTPEEVVAAVDRALAAQSLSRPQAEQALGFVLLESVRPSDEHPPATYYRRCALLRAVGLLSACGPLAPEPVRLDDAAA